MRNRNFNVDESFMRFFMRLCIMRIRSRLLTLVLNASPCLRTVDLLFLLLLLLLLLMHRRLTRLLRRLDRVVWSLEVSLRWCRPRIRPPCILARKFPFAASARVVFIAAEADAESAVYFIGAALKSERVGAGAAVSYR